MPKILFIVTSLNSGGIENYLLRFLKQYEGKLEATVFCKGGEFGDLHASFLKLKGVHLERKTIGYINPGDFIFFHRFLRKRKFQTVCDFTGNFAGTTVLISQMAGIKNRIAFYRGSTNRFKENKFNLIYNNFVKRLVLKHSTKILSNSQSAFNYFFPIIDERFIVVYNGVDKEEFQKRLCSFSQRNKYNIPDDAFVIGHTGRVHFSKNHEILLEIASSLCRKHKNIHFVFCGKCTEELPIGQVDPQYRSQIHLLGYQSDIPEILNLFDLFIFPSVTEGQPNALIEAMIAGLPILASDIEPIKESVPKNFLDHLISPNDFQKFIERIEELYLNQNSLDDLRLKDWAAKKFDHKTQFAQFFNLLTN